MNTISRVALTKVENESIANGSNQLHDGVIACAPAFPIATRTSATTANTASITTSTASRTFCTLAEMSMPRTATQVIAAMKAIPTSSTQGLDESVPMPSASKSRNEYCALTCARLAITSRSATTIAQPDIQPQNGPKARVAHTN